MKNNKLNILISKKQYYIDLLKPDYDILKVASSKLGYKHSENTRIQISINNTGMNHSFLGKKHTYKPINPMEESPKL
jgi:hypothetical protein